MAMVEVTGKVTDAGGVLIPAVQNPRLWAVPVKATAYGDALLTDDEVDCNLDPDTGEFTVLLNNAPGLRYVLMIDRLPPGQETEPPKNRARNWVQWSNPFWPANGGDIGDLPPVEVVGLMWIGTAEPPGGPAWMNGTRWLDTNPSSSAYGWIKKWGGMGWELEWNARGPAGTNGSPGAKGDPGVGFEMADVPGYAFALVAKDGRAAENSVLSDGTLPQWAAEAIVARGSGAVGASKVKLVACGGQSKATRRYDGEGSPAAFPAHPRVWYYDHTAGVLVPDEGVGWIGRGFAIEDARDHPDTIYVTVQASVGSTGFSTTSIDPAPEGYYTGTGTWDRTLTADPNRYPQTLLINRVNEAAAAALARWNENPDRVLLFSMGEADKANSIGGMPAAEYQAKQDDLFTWLRTQAGWAGAPIIVGSLSYTQIYKTPEGVAYDEVHMNTPARVPLTAYDRAVSGFDENTSFNTHLVMAGQDLQGRRMARLGLPRALQNDPAVTASTAILPPEDVQVRRVGSRVQISWTHPQCRATSFRLETSTDESTWTAVTLSSPLAIDHEVVSADPLFVRLSTTNENGTSYSSRVMGA